jgi:single-stranded-DNA-specific exonuclease
MHPVLRQVLASRGVGPAELSPSLAALIPVGELPGVQAAAARLVAARGRGERVLVLGDFDADGATATALMVRVLTGLGFPDVQWLIPNRFALGYGLSPGLAELAARHSPALLVTVDNGVTSVAGVARANELGMQVIVTDHHLAGAELPAAAHIVNPNLPGSTFPSRHLSGVGVAFYLLAVLGRQLAAAGAVDPAAVRALLNRHLDLVALGTVADMVPLDFNNRVLVAEGLRRMRAGRLAPGIAALCRAANRDPARIKAADLGFAVAPRLNAAGRLEDMGQGVACLLADDPRQAQALAARLDALNHERRGLQARMVDEARSLLAGVDALVAGEAPVLCLFDPGWHQGVVGLVATRIREQTGRPVIAFAPDGDERLLRGSARSVPGLNIRDAIAAALRGLADPDIRFGGHAMAAGITLPATQLDRFRESLCAEVARAGDAAIDPGVVWSDGELKPGDLTLELAAALEQAGPWGQGFPEPVFDNQFLLLDERVVGGSHLRLKLAHPGGGEPVDAIAFGQPPLGRPERLRCAYRLDINWYRERESRQLVVEHIDCD